MFSGSNDDLVQLNYKHRHRSDEQEQRRNCKCAGPTLTGFEQSAQWDYTKKVCTCLFQSLGQYYDEVWFPTVVKEWCMLYYRCNYEDKYWKFKDEWLAGDEEVRMAIWSDILRYRGKYDQRRMDLRNRMLVDITQIPSASPQNMNVNEDAARMVEMFECISEAKDVIELRKMDMKDVLHVSSLACDADRAKAEIEAAEIALADPDDDPNWVAIRCRMRGSFAALNSARAYVSKELLSHMMSELCKYWASAQPIDYVIEPLMEKNIMREIENFRYKVFRVNVDIEPERLPESLEHEAEQEPEQEPDQRVLQQPEPPQPAERKKTKSRKTSGTRQRSESNTAQPPTSTQQPTTPTESQPQINDCKRSRRPSSRGPTSNKLAEARAKLNAERMKKFENRGNMYL